MRFQSALQLLQCSQKAWICVRTHSILSSSEKQERAVASVRGTVSQPEHSPGLHFHLDPGSHFALPIASWLSSPFGCHALHHLLCPAHSHQGLEEQRCIPSVCSPGLCREDGKVEFSRAGAVFPAPSAAFLPSPCTYLIFASFWNKRDSEINNMKRGGDDKEYLENYLCPHFGALHGKQKPFFLINVRKPWIAGTVGTTPLWWTKRALRKCSAEDYQAWEVTRGCCSRTRANKSKLKGKVCYCTANGHLGPAWARQILATSLLSWKKL